MPAKLVSAALSCICLLTCASALGWTKEGEKLVFHGGEVDHCSALAVEAAAIMYGRQNNEPPHYERDAYYPPTASTLSLRDSLSKLVLAYPVRDTEEEKQKDLQDFINMARGTCVKAYIESVPPSSPN